MRVDEGPLSDEAILWAARVQDAEFEDWDDHAKWLTSSPENPERYRVASMAIEDGANQLRPPPKLSIVAANDDTPPAGFGSSRRGLLAAAAAMAACIVAIVGRTPDEPVAKVLATSMGERHLARLPDGTVVTLNGSTSVRLLTPRRVSIEHGEAFVTVRHDAAHPFELIANGKIFRDVGTSFNVRVSEGAVRFQVADGRVLFDPEGVAIGVNAGQGLVLASTGITRTTNSPSSVGGWRTGRLVYRDASLTEVAEDLSRLSGRAVSVAPALERRRFTGVVTIPPGRKAIAADIGQLLDVDVIADRDHWRLEAARSPAAPL